MALAPYGKQQLAEEIRQKVRHFQLIGTYYPNGLEGGNEQVFPVVATPGTFSNDYLLGTSNPNIYAFTRTDNALELSTQYAPGGSEELEFQMQVGIGEAIVITGVRIFQGKQVLDEWVCAPNQPEIYDSYEILDHTFGQSVTFTSNGTFTITGFELTVN